MHHGSGVSRVGVTRDGNRRTPNFFDLFKMKKFAIFGLLHKEIEFIPKNVL